MNTPEATGLITVTAIPSGEAPEKIRRAWVGLTLPCYPFTSQSNLLMGVVSKNIRRERKLIVTVPQADALEILEKERPKAARWWKDNGFPMKTVKNFCFDLSGVTIVSGVTRTKIMEVTDEMQGDPTR